MYSNLIIAVVVISLVLAGYLYVRGLQSSLDKQIARVGFLTAANVILEENSKTLSSNIATITTVNDANQKVIGDLLDERKKSVTAINYLAKQDRKNLAEIEDKNKRIDELIKAEPGLDAPAAEILKQTVKQLGERK